MRVQHNRPLLLFLQNHRTLTCALGMNPRCQLLTLYRSLSSSRTQPTPPPQPIPSSDFLELQKVVRQAGVVPDSFKTTTKITNGGLPTAYPPLVEPDYVQANSVRTSRPTTPRKVNLMDRLDSQRTKQREQAEQAKQAEKLLEEKQRQKPFRERTAQDFINQESNLRSRDKLTKEAFSGGYWKDFHEVSRKGAKLWEAPEKIRSGQHSQPIPNVTGRLMSGEKTDVMSYVSKHKVTMVVFFFNAFGEQQTKSFIKPFMDEFKTHPNIDLLILNVEEKFLRAPILWLARPYVRWNIPEELRSRYMIHYGSIKESRMACGMMNNVLGWVNLVDSSGRIRWQAHGNATQRELQSVSLLTKTLLRLS